MTTWLFVASIVDLMMILSGCAIWLRLDRKGFELSEIRDRAFGSGCWYELLLTLFYSVWIVFGIILIQQLEDTQMLVAVMFSWCIIQGITDVLVRGCSRVAQMVADNDRLLLCFDICPSFDLSDCSGCISVFARLMLQVVGIAADIAAMIIAFDYDCNNATLNDGSSLGSLDVNSWIFVGAI